MEPEVENDQQQPAPEPPPPAEALPAEHQQHQRRQQPRQPQYPPSPGGNRIRGGIDTRFERGLAVFGLASHSIVQLRELSTSTPTERWQRLLSMAWVSLFWVLPELAPRWYQRHRTPTVTAIKLGFYSFPLLRRPRGIQRVLEVPARPGALGWAADLLRIAWGCRLIAVLYLGVFPSGSLLPHLAIQAYGTWFVRSNKSLCATKLLADPLTVWRLWVSHFSLLALLLLLAPPLALPALLLFPSTDKASCEAFLTFWHIVIGIIISTSLPVRLGTHSVKGQPGGSTAWPDVGQALAALRQAAGWRARLQAACGLLTALQQRATELCSWDDGAAARRREEVARARAEREQRHRAHMRQALELWHQLQQQAQQQQGQQKDPGNSDKPGSSSGSDTAEASTAAAQPPVQQLSWDAGRLRFRQLCQECAEQEQCELAWCNAFRWAKRLGWAPLLLAVTWAAALLLPVPT